MHSQFRGVRVKGIIALALVSLCTAGMSARAEDAGDPRAFVAEFKSGTVGVLDTRQNKILRHIVIPKGAHGITILPDGSRVFVSSDESSVISVIDAVTDRIVGSIPTGRQPHGLITGPGGRFVYACIFGDNQILEIEPGTLKVVRTFDAPGPHNLACAPDGSILYVAAQKPGGTGLLAIDLRSGAAAPLVPTGTIPRSINLSPDGKRLVSTQADRNEVQFYSTRPLTLVRAVAAGEAPHHVIYTPDGKLVLVVNQVSNDLTVIDAGTMTVVRTIPVGKKPHWIAPTADSRYAYVTDESSDQVSLVDIRDGDVEQTIPTGGAPRKIALQAVATGNTAPGGATRESGAMHEEKGGKRVTVRIEGPPPRFVPETTTVEAGTTIEWVNNGHGVHTVTDNDGAWDSGSLGPGETFTHTFDQKGTFGYYCVPHRSMGMTGTIVVR